MIKAVIFDLDGTILYTLEDLKNAVNYSLVKHNYPEKTLEQIKGYVGDGIGMLIRRSLPKEVDQATFESALSVFKDYYKQHMYDYTKPYDDIIDVIKELKANNIKIGIVSNKADFAVKVLADKFFNNLIDISIGEMEGVKRKPAPDTLNLAMKELNLSNDQCVYVGDSDVDILTAKNASVPCISVTWGFRDAEFLVKNGATKLIANPKDLLKIF